MINYMLEFVCLVLISNSNGDFITSIFTLIKSVGTPIIYYIGIEENRAQTREFIKSRINYFIPKFKRETSKNENHEL